MTDRNGKLRAKSDLTSNPVGLSEKVAREMATALDRHQASLFVLFHQYQKHHWVVVGPQFRDLHLFFQEAYEQVHKQVDALAERVTLLGGTPTASPIALAELSYLEHEQEGVFPVREMLERDQTHEAEVARELRATIKRATELGDYGTETLLKHVLTHVEDRAHHLDNYLDDDSLEDGRVEEHAAAHKGDA